MQLKNKMFLIFLFFAFFLIFNSNVFATSDNFTVEYSQINSSYLDIYYENDVYNYMSSVLEDKNELKEYKYIVAYKSNTDYYFALSKNPFFVNKGKFYSSSFVVTCRYNSSGVKVQLQCPPVDSTGFYYSTDVVINNSTVYSNNTIYSDSNLETVYTNSHLITDNENFFQLPPMVVDQEIPVVVEKEIPTLAEVVALGHQQAKEITQESLETELAELIPVGVIIMATLITVYLVAYFKFWRG